jgi:hypothetical protein
VSFSGGALVGVRGGRSGLPIPDQGAELLDDRGSVELAGVVAGRRRRPEIPAYVWFNHDKESDWRVQSSSSAQVAYARGLVATRYIG